MTRFVVCWEDRYFEGLDVVLRRIRRHENASLFPEPAIKSETVKGHGGFVDYIRKDWPIALRRGIPGFGVPDYLLCVADADSASQVCRGISTPPLGNSDDWCEQANQTWTASLRGLAAQESERVFGFFLRWSRESVLIAGFDEPAMIERLANGAFSLHKQTFEAFLQSCLPEPRSIQRFVDAYTKPNRCFDGLVEALGHKSLRKTDPKVEDTLKQFPRSPGESLLSRLPDLVGMAREINRLSQSSS